MLTTVARFREPWEAHMLRGRLEAEGIPASILNEHQIGIDWRYSDARGGTQVQVPSSLTEDARAIELQCKRGVYREELRAELGDLDDLSCPICGGTKYWKRRTAPQVLLSVFLVFFVVMTPPWTWICVCENCGRKFRTGPHPFQHAGIAILLGLVVGATLPILLYVITAPREFWQEHPVVAWVFKAAALTVMMAVVISVARKMRRQDLSDGGDNELE